MEKANPPPWTAELLEILGSIALELIAFGILKFRGAPRGMLASFPFGPSHLSHSLLCP